MLTQGRRGPTKCELLTPCISRRAGQQLGTFTGQSGRQGESVSSSGSLVAPLTTHILRSPHMGVHRSSSPLQRKRTSCDMSHVPHSIPLHPPPIPCLLRWFYKCFGCGQWMGWASDGPAGGAGSPPGQQQQRSGPQVSWGLSGEQVGGAAA